MSPDSTFAALTIRSSLADQPHFFDHSVRSLPYNLSPSLSLSTPPLSSSSIMDGQFGSCQSQTVRRITPLSSLSSLPKLSSFTRSICRQFLKEGKYSKYYINAFIADGFALRNWAHSTTTAQVGVTLGSEQPAQLTQLGIAARGGRKEGRISQSYFQFLRQRLWSYIHFGYKCENL